MELRLSSGGTGRNEENTLSTNDLTSAILSHVSIHKHKHPQARITMGTRNSTLIQLDGQYKLAQYGQWDGYPSGQGATALAFLRTLNTAAKRAAFAAKVKALKVLTDAEQEALYNENAHETTHPHFSRDCGAEVLALINKGKATEIGNNINLEASFVKDPLFCEWAYVIDLDKGTFEVFKGFNTRALGKGQRFYFDGHKGEEQRPYDNEKGKPYRYYPVRLLKSYNLAKLPTEKQFLADCEPKDE